MTDATTTSPQEPQDEPEAVYEISASSFYAMLLEWRQLADEANALQCRCSRRRRSSRTRPPGRPGLTVVPR